MNTSAEPGADRAPGLVSVRYTGRNGAGYALHNGKSWRIEKGKTVQVPADLAESLVASGNYTRKNKEEAR
jgi:hypothetical protein